MELNETENRVSSTPVWGLKKTRVPGGLKHSQESAHFHRVTDSYNDIKSELEETFEIIRGFTDE